MRLTTLLPLLVAAHQALSAPLADRSSKKSGPFHAIKTVVRVSKHSGALESFIASEEVTTSISRTRRPGKAEHRIDNTPVDVSDIISPSDALDVERPLPTGFLVSLSRPTEHKDEEKKSQTTTHWAMALLKDVYADYKSVAPCWRQHSVEASETIRSLTRGKTELLIFLGIGVLITGILILEAIYQNVMSLRRRISTGEIRLEGPERSLEAQDCNNEHLVAEREGLIEKEAAV